MPDIPRVAASDLFQFEDIGRLPYLKHVGLAKSTPGQYNLEKWTRMFVIPDSMMRKIYRDEVWKDTDAPKHEPEKLSRQQKSELHKWLCLHSPFKDDYPKKLCGTRSRHQYQDCTDLIRILDKEEHLNDCDNSEIHSDKHGKPSTGCDVDHFDDNELKISLCLGHKFQPEYVIVKKALSKMRNLSSEDEESYRDLLKDKEFMEFLHNNIGNYLGKSQKSHSVSGDRR